MNKFIFLCCFLLAGFAPLSEAGAAIFGASEFYLDNGLRVIVVPNRKAPIVKQMLWYKVGSVDEKPGQGGTAHLLEHLMFRGTKKVSHDTYNDVTQSNGMDGNAFTSQDFTAYHQSMDISRLELAMFLEADRMQNLDLSQENFELERDIVYQERKQVVENNPAAEFNENLRRLMWGEHPYARPITGTPEEIKNLKLDDVRDFYNQYYAPNNAILVLAGDIDAKTAKILAEKYYGGLKPKSAPKDIEWPELKSDKSTHMEMSLPRINSVRIINSWIAPSYAQEKNDIYAIGALMMALYLRHEIVPEMSTPELLRIKLKKGSYQALLADDHIPNQISPVLRNLLNDNVENRLNYIQAYNLLDGKTGNYSSSTATDRPKRTISFNGEKFYNTRDFAIAISNAPTEAYELVKSGKLLDWIKNGLENEKLAGKIEKLLTTYPEGTTSTDIIISKICILLMPDLPLKLNNLCLFPDGAPKAIFYALRNGMETKPFYELFSAELIKLWYQEQEHMRSPANAAEFRIYINRQDIGYGLDRIMYDFDDDIPCVSSLLGDEFVNSPTRILRALDNTYSKQIVKSMPYDRNIIAYLRCKMGKKIDGILTDLATGKDYLQASAILRLYTSMQNKFGPAQLPHLSQWLASSSISIIKSYHNLKYQKFLERELLKINKNGKLHELCDILEDEEARNKDKANYTKAVSDINFLLSEKNKLINNSSKIDDEARNMAIRFTSILAIMVMLASFLFNLILWVLK